MPSPSVPEWQTEPGWFVTPVECRSLRDILAPIDRVDYLSVDIGSGDFEALAAAREDLDRVRVLQVSTIQESADKIAELLQREGWLNVYRFAPGATSDTPYGAVTFNQGLQTWLHPAAASVRRLFSSVYPMVSVHPTVSGGGAGTSVFDTQEALDLNAARMAHLASLGLPLEGRRVLDVGGGVGHLSLFFVERNCDVLCTDARDENIVSLRSRYPSLASEVLNVETDSLSRFGRFDIVLCYGLLYHLENPMAALRNMASVCSDLLLLETVVVDRPETLVLAVDEPSATPNQTMDALGSRPSPAYVALALNRAGFPFIYAPKTPPDHPDFRFEWKADLAWSRDGHLLRCVFVASRRELHNAELIPLVQDDQCASGSALVHPLNRATSRIWIDVGAHLGEHTRLIAEQDPTVTVYAFEPNLAVASRSMGRVPNFVMIPAAIAESDGVATLYINSCSGADSLLPLNPEGLKDWTGAEQPHVDREIKVPALRLDTFLDQMGIAEVEYLKINAQGSDLAVVRSAGDRLRDIRKITLTVYPTNQPMYSGAALRDEAIDFMRRSGFDLVSSEEQSFGQQQSLTFVQVDNPPTT